MGYSRKIQTGRGVGLRIYCFENPHGIFNFFILSLEVPGKTKFNPCISYKVVLDPLEIPQGQKQRPLEISHFFLVTLGNSTSFLINSWKFHSMWLFLWYPWKFHILNPPPLYLRGEGRTFQILNRSHWGRGVEGVPKILLERGWYRNGGRLPLFCSFNYSTIAFMWREKGKFPYYM